MLLNTSHRFCELGITKHVSLKQAFMFLSVFVHNSSRVKFAVKFSFIWTQVLDVDFTLMYPFR